MQDMYWYCHDGIAPREEKRVKEKEKERGKGDALLSLEAHEHGDA